MEFMLDTINLEEIKYYNEILPLSGVTSNPSIIKKEGKIDLFKHLRKIKEIIKDGSLHVQVVGENPKEIIEDAKRITKELGKETFIKIPINEEGLAAIKILKKEDYNITATGIYTEFQAYLSIAMGADYLAVYYNRMENLNIDSEVVIRSIANEINRTNSNSKILAASFKNVSQFNKACQAGAHGATMGVDIYKEAFNMPSIRKAVDDFKRDWIETFNVKNISEV